MSAYPIILYSIETGTLTSNPVSKQKLVIAPVISQLGQTSSGDNTNVGSQSSSSKHMANLLLPIPQTSVSLKPTSMFSSKLSNGQMSAESKGTITGSRMNNQFLSCTHEYMCFF